jgi:hypothetical protein
MEHYVNNVSKHGDVAIEEKKFSLFERFLQIFISTMALAAILVLLNPVEKLHAATTTTVQDLADMTEQEAYEWLSSQGKLENLVMQSSGGGEFWSYFYGDIEVPKEVYDIIDGYMDNPYKYQNDRRYTGKWSNYAGTGVTKWFIEGVEVTEDEFAKRADNPVERTLADITENYIKNNQAVVIIENLKEGSFGNVNQTV